jgi:predicted RNA-binding protein YlxR (DUF448 family)
VNPVRTCVGCGNRSEKAQLTRLVVSDGAIVVDAAQTFPGRGAYLHPQSGCWRQALRKRALVRKLPAGDADTERLRVELAAVANRQRRRWDPGRFDETRPGDIEFSTESARNPRADIVRPYRAGPEQKVGEQLMTTR